MAIVLFFAVAAALIALIVRLAGGRRTSFAAALCKPTVLLAAAIIGGYQVLFTWYFTARASALPALLFLVECADHRPPRGTATGMVVAWSADTMTKVSASNEFVVHEDPVWRDRSNFIINAELPEKDLPKRYEQLFVRQIIDNRFEICCIPFFLYDVALGDIVHTAPKGDRKYVLSGVAEPSGRYVFRVWFGESFLPLGEIAKHLATLGAQLEWSSRNLLAVDTPDEPHARQVADFLAAREDADRMLYESGRS